MDWLNEAGETGRLIAGRDWSRTPLGPITEWPQSLRTALAIVLLSPVPMVMLWGGDGVMLYNDAYSEFVGGRHPDLLGSKVREGWPEVADFNDNVMKVGLAGGTLAYRDQELTLVRHGKPEPVWMNLDYSPVLDEDGQPAGVIAIVIETTERVAAERCAAAERERLATEVRERRRTEDTLREQSRLLETLNRTGAAIAGEIELEPLIQLITDAGVELTGAKFGSYFHNIMDETGERLHLFTLSGAAREDFMKLGRPRATAVFGPTFRNEGVIRSADILADPRYGQMAPHRGMPKGHLPVRSYLAVPVVSRTGVVLGGLLFGHPEPDCFDESHEHLMVGIAAQAAIAIDNARLFQELQAARDTLEQRVEERTRELSEAHEALRQAQKMEAVGQLTGGIAHDFNNLLTGISGGLEIIERRIAEGRSDGVGRFLAGAQTSAQRAAALTQRLLAFSRRQTLDPKPIDVNRLVFGMEDLIRRTVGPSITVEVVGAGGLWPAKVDAAQLESALLNLAINARDAMPDGGRLTIETANKWLDDRWAKARDLPPGQYLSLCVTDTGTGIPKDVVDRIFDPFFTTKPIGQGTGLGLSMIHGFVRQSGGQVRVYTEPGQGTTMCLYLPRYVGELAEDIPAPDAHSPESGAGQTVLVIDDEPTVRMLIVELLDQAGYRVIEAEDGPSGLKVLHSPTKIDLLITDVGLPGGMNGRQVADAARVTRPDLKILFVTGFAENAAVGNGHLDHGMAVVTKPFVMADLSKRIAEMLEG
jgi:PAS domain S-box-containing protein